MRNDKPRPAGYETICTACGDPIRLDPCPDLARPGKHRFVPLIWQTIGKPGRPACTGIGTTWMHRPDPRPAGTVKVCDGCGRPFASTHPDPSRHRFCTKQCQRRDYNKSRNTKQKAPTS